MKPNSANWPVDSTVLKMQTNYSLKLFQLHFRRESYAYRLNADLQINCQNIIANRLLGDRSSSEVWQISVQKEFHQIGGRRRWSLKEV